MSASTDNTRETHPARLWRPAGLWHLAGCLGALAAGFWPGAIVGDRYASGAAPLHALQCVAVWQVAFIMLLWPLILMRRSLRNGEILCPLRLSGEALVMMLTAGPVYLLGAYLADGVTTDAVRLWLFLAGTWPLGLLVGMHLAGGFRTACLLGAVFVVMGLPAAFYISAEFFHASAGTLWNLSPALFAWSVAAPRGGTYWPMPLWAWLIWPAAAVVAAAVLWTFCKRRPSLS